jgi:hypothetical protein
MPLTFFATTAHICAMMMRIDQDKFIPPFVKLSTSPYCTSISSQYNSPHYDNNTQHGARYNSTECTTLPLPGKIQHTHLSTVNVHNTRLIDSAHFAHLCHTIIHTVVCHSFTYVTIVRLAVLVLYHTLVDSTLELSQM